MPANNKSRGRQRNNGKFTSQSGREAGRKGGKARKGKKTGASRSM